MGKRSKLFQTIYFQNPQNSDCFQEVFCGSLEEIMVIKKSLILCANESNSVFKIII
jgi:hypothetical protein